MKKPSVMLIHGWDPSLYNRAHPKTGMPPDMAWAKGGDFLRLLGQISDLEFCQIPGFCGTPEPESTGYSVEDFSRHILKTNPTLIHADIVIGFSFGGALALNLKALHQIPAKIVLLSPAIRRRSTLKSHFASIVRLFLPKPMRNSLRKKYQGVVNRYYRLGSTFIRESYDIVAREDLVYLISKVAPGEALYVFGERDEETPWALVAKPIKANRARYTLIAEAGHATIRSHASSVVDAIVAFIK